MKPDYQAPPQRVLPVLQKLKAAYLLWFEYYQKIPKPHRYSLGQRIDTLFVESMEAISVASFLPRNEKLLWIKLATRKMDTAKILLMIAWETKSLHSKQYIALSLPLDEVGKMLGGWSGQVTRQQEKDKENSPNKTLKEKNE